MGNDGEPGKEERNGCTPLNKHSCIKRIEIPRRPGHGNRVSTAPTPNEFLVTLTVDNIEQTPEHALEDVLTGTGMRISERVTDTTFRVRDTGTTGNQPGTQTANESDKLSQTRSEDSKHDSDTDMPDCAHVTESVTIGRDSGTVSDPAPPAPRPVENTSVEQNSSASLFEHANSPYELIGECIQTRYQAFCYFVAQAESAATIDELQSMEIGDVFTKARTSDSDGFVVGIVSLPGDGDVTPSIDRVVCADTVEQCDEGDMVVVVPVGETLSLEAFRELLRIGLQQEQERVKALTADLTELVS